MQYSEQLKKIMLSAKTRTIIYFEVDEFENDLRSSKWKKVDYLWQP